MEYSYREARGGGMCAIPALDGALGLRRGGGLANLVLDTVAIKGAVDGEVVAIVGLPDEPVRRNRVLVHVVERLDVDVEEELPLVQLPVCAGIRVKKTISLPTERCPGGEMCEYTAA